MGDDLQSQVEACAAEAKAGGGDAVSRLLDLLRPELAEAIRQARLRPHDAEDGAQEAVVIVLRCLPSHDPALGTFMAYVLSSVRKMLRGIRRTFTCEAAMFGAESVYDWDDSLVVAADLIDEAPHAEIVRAFFGIDGPERSLNQIAAVTGRSPREVRAALMEALGAMRGN